MSTRPICRMFHSLLHTAPHAGSVMPMEATQGTRCRNGGLIRRQSQHWQSIHCPRVTLRASNNTYLLLWYSRDAKTSQKSRSHLKILGATRVTRSKFHIEEPQISGATGQNLLATATWRPGFEHTSGSALCQIKTCRPCKKLGCFRFDGNNRNTPCGRHVRFGDRSRMCKRNCL
jgi:hypothetical protein